MSVLAPTAAERVEERQFLLRLAALMGIVIVVPWLLWALVVPHEGLVRFVPVAFAVLVFVVAFIRYPSEALFGFALFVLFYDTLAIYLGEPIRRVDELTVPGLVLVAAVRLLPHLRRWFWWPRELAIVVLFVAAVASSLLGDVPIRIWGVTLALVFKGLAFFYVAISLDVRAPQLRGAMKVLAGIGLVVVALSFVELVNPIAFQGAVGLPEYLRKRGPLFVVKSLFTHPVLYAWFTALVAILAYAVYAETRRWRYLAMAAFFSLGPFLGARRRAILALLGALAAAFTTYVWRTRAFTAVIRRWAPIGATMALILVVFIPALSTLWDSTVNNYINPTPNPSASPGTVGEGEGEAPPQVRIALYMGASEIARDHFPLGAGLGRWGSWMSREYYSPLYYEYHVSGIKGLRPRDPRNVTDTFWPQILGETGALGFVAYAGWLLSMAAVLLKALRRHAPGGAIRIFLFAALMVWVQAGVESLASPMFHSPPRTYLTFLILGAGTAVAWRVARRDRAAAPSEIGAAGA